MTTWNGMTIAAINNIKIAVDNFVFVLRRTHAAMAEKIVMPTKEKVVITKELTKA
jgi:hypothetical protein